MSGTVRFQPRGPRILCHGSGDESDRIVVLAGDAKLVPLLERLEEMDVPVTLISSLSVPRSIAPPPPLVALANDFIDLADDDRFFLPEHGQEDIRE